MELRAIRPARKAVDRAPFPWFSDESAIVPADAAVGFQAATNRGPLRLQFPRPRHTAKR
jgi:hypothetical protein